nr:TolC family protein [uncultured Sphaerochaeta sp.]
MKRRSLYLCTVLISLSFPLLGAIPGNLELAALQEEANQAILDVRDAKASRWPTVELELSGTYMSNPLIGPITLPAGSLGPGTPPSNLSLFEGMESSMYDFSVNITQPLFTWGKINASVDAQEAIAEAKLQELQNREKELHAEISTRAVIITELEAITQLLKQQHTLGRELVLLASEAVASGMMLELEQLETEVALQDIELAILENEYAITEQTLTLRTLTNNQDISSYTFDGQAIKELLQPPVKTLIEYALSPRQPSIRALSALKKATEAAVRITKGSFYGKPDLALVMSAGYSSPNFPVSESDWSNQDAYSISVSVGLKTTLFDGGKIANSIKRAESQEQSATLDLQQARQRITQEVQEQYLLMKTSMQKIDLQERKQTTLQQRVRTNKELYQSGYGTREDLLQAEMNLLSSQIHEHQLNIEAWSAFQTLQYLTGN